MVERTLPDKTIGVTPDHSMSGRDAVASEIQREFLLECFHSGSFDALNVRRRNLIGIYFGSSRATYDNLTDIAGGTSLQNVRRMIMSGITTLWETLPPNLQEKYPLDEVRRSKRKSGTRSPETRRKDAMRLRELWQNPDFRSNAIAAAHNPDATKQAGEARHARMQHPKLKAVFDATQNTPEVVERRSTTARKQWENPEYAQSLIDASHTPEARVKLSKSMKKVWEKPERRSKIRKSDARDSNP